MLYVDISSVCVSSLNTSLMIDNEKYRDTNCGSGMLHTGTLVLITVIKELISDNNVSRETISHISRGITDLKKSCIFFPNPSSEMFRS